MSTQPQNQKRRNDRIQINVSFGFTLIFTSFHIISQHLAMEIYNRKNLFFSHKLLTKVSPPTAPIETRPSFTTGGDDDHRQQAKHYEDSTKGILDGDTTEYRIRSLVMREWKNMLLMNDIIQPPGNMSFGRFLRFTSL